MASGGDGVTLERERVRRAVAPPVARSLSRAYAEALRVAGISRHPTPLGFGNLAFAVQSGRRVDFNVASVLCLELDLAPIYVALTEEAHAALCAALEIPVHSPVEDGAMSALVLENALDAAFSALESHIGAATRVVRWGKEGPRGARRWVGGIIVDGTGARSSIAFGVSEDDLLKVSAWLAPVPTAPINDAMINLSFRLFFPSLTTTLDELNALSVGDMIFDQLSWADLRMAMGGVNWRCRMNDDGSVLMDSPAPQSGTGVSFDQAEVELSFELARLSAPLELTRAIEPGYVFQLGRRLGAEVDIYAGARRFGRGRLVEIDGEMGVEVLKTG